MEHQEVKDLPTVKKPKLIITRKEETVSPTEIYEKYEVDEESRVSFIITPLTHLQAKKRTRIEGSIAIAISRACANFGKTREDFFNVYYKVVNDQPITKEESEFYYSIETDDEVMAKEQFVKDMLLCNVKSIIWADGTKDPFNDEMYERVNPSINNWLYGQMLERSFLNEEDLLGL